MTSNNHQEAIVQKQTNEQSLVTALMNDNVLDFQMLIKQKLQDKFTTAINVLQNISESVDTESQARLDIEAAAKSFGGNSPVYSNGVLIVNFDDKDSAADFSSWLDDYKTVESYELNVLSDNEDIADSDIDVDFDTITNDETVSFEFVIYLRADIVSYDSEENDEDEEDISEALRTIKVSGKGKKSIKMKCNPGFSWDAETRSCQKITGDKLINIRKGVRKRLMTMKAEGPSLRKRINIKTKKAMKFRRSMGLD